MSLDANTAASSAAPTPAAEPGNFLSTLSREQYDTWSRTGAIPDTTPTETPKADPSPAPPDTPAPETPHAADSSPATPEKRTDPRAEENRIPKLLEERARERERADRLERELADLRRQVTPPKETPTADSSPAPAAPPKASVAYPPALGSYDAYLAANPESSYEDYQDARTDSWQHNFSKVDWVRIRWRPCALVLFYEAQGKHSWHTTQSISMETLRLLKHKLDYEEDFKKEYAVGDTIRVKYPWRPILRDGFAYTRRTSSASKPRSPSISPSASTSTGHTIDKLLNMERGEEKVKKEYLEAGGDLPRGGSRQARGAVRLQQNTGNITGVLGTNPTTFDATSAAARQRF
jgi:hypothetical protein